MEEIKEMAYENELKDYDKGKQFINEFMNSQKQMSSSVNKLKEGALKATDEKMEF